MQNEPGPLKGIDYMTMPLQELLKHPDYSQHASRVINAIMDMNSEQLENLEISGVPKKR